MRTPVGYANDEGNFEYFKAFDEGKNMDKKRNELVKGGSITIFEINGLV
jgi:hypothetical protein